ncbi:pectin lyase [Asticcacaulis sp. AC460]|uniref:right-handed parallel beta-helix repeat-containing protein n=1 Tax=Asticcacaulis sp. AC460 TaxID=1282360 RepID=UPI0003C3F5B0|nr:right-handed parallel beta-helix repeat-containing protein [Asticcacaulis sp. AC460]ESQ88334.1 pectin lyase [Asticcacaulis sp. AC460]
MPRIACLLLSASLLALAAPALADIRIHVSPSGSDSGDGSASRPFRTLPRAQDAVRAVNAKDDVIVTLADGVYVLDKPLNFRTADGGQGKFTVTWQAASKADPLISGGMTVNGFTLFDADKNVYVADTPKGLDSRQLWINGVTAERPKIELKREDVEFTPTSLILKDAEHGYIAKLKQPNRLEVEYTGFFTDRYAPVKAIDGDTLIMQQPSWDNNTFGYDTISSPIFPDDSRLFLVNAPELFGVTNQWHSNSYQWYIDPDAGKLYIRIPPDADVATLSVVLPRLDHLISIGGTLDAPVKNLSFKGLHLSHTSWMGPSLPTGYASQQSGAYLVETAASRPVDAYRSCGWGCVEFETLRQRWSQMPAAVQVSAAKNVVFDGMSFTHLGQIALGIGNDDNAHASGQGLAADGVTVRNSRFSMLGGGAVMAGGVREPAHHPDDPRLVNRNIVIENNVITNVSQDYKENAAVLTTYVDGAKIVHNDISEAPYDAIDIGWGWGYNDAGGNPNYRENQRGYEVNKVYDTPTTLRNTIVANNRVHGVKTWYKDGGAIYNLSANPGGEIRENHISDIGGAIGIYVDEGSKHLRIERNVVETRGWWLNANTVGKQYKRGITTDNVATGNWHDSNQVGGRWNAESGNSVAQDNLVTDKDWPAEARKVMEKAGADLPAAREKPQVKPQQQSQAETCNGPGNPTDYPGGKCPKFHVPRSKP